MKTDWSTYQITYDGKTYDLHYRNAVDLIACEGYVPNSPSPDYPSPILSAGGNILVSNGITTDTYTLPTLHGIGTVKDTFDVLTGDKVAKWGVKVFDGTETAYNSLVTDNFARCTFVINNTSGDWVNNSTKYLCSHGIGALNVYYATVEGIVIDGRGTAPSYTAVMYISLSKAKLATYDISGIKAYLAAQYAAGTPVTVLYQLATPVTTDGAAQTVRSFPKQTTITQDGAAKGMVTAGALIIDKGVI